MIHLPSFFNFTHCTEKFVCRQKIVVLYDIYSRTQLFNWIYPIHMVWMPSGMDAKWYACQVVCMPSGMHAKWYACQVV